MDRKKYWNQPFLNCFLKIKAADLRKIGLQMREWHFENLAPKFPCDGRVMSLTSLPPPSPPPCLPFPLGKFASGAFFALPAMNGPSPAELKFKENTGSLLNRGSAGSF